MNRMMYLTAESGQSAGSGRVRPIRRRHRRQIQLIDPGIPSADNRWYPSRGQARKAALKLARAWALAAALSGTEQVCVAAGRITMSPAPALARSPAISFMGGGWRARCQLGDGESSCGKPIRSLAWGQARFHRTSPDIFSQWPASGMASMDLCYGNWCNARRTTFRPARRRRQQPPCIVPPAP